MEEEINRMIRGSLIIIAIGTVVLTLSVFGAEDTMYFLSSGLVQTAAVVAVLAFLAWRIYKHIKHKKLAEKIEGDLYDPVRRAKGGYQVRLGSETVFVSDEELYPKG